MNKTIHFTKLDYLTIKPYLTLKNLIIILAIMLLLGYGTGPFMPIGMLMMYSNIYSSYPFAVGDKNGIDTLYATLPITKKNIVTGRYIFTLSLNVIAGFAAFAIAFIMANLLGKEFAMSESLGTLVGCFWIFSVLEFIQLPIYFKLGYSKAKFLAYLPLIAFSGVIMATSSILGKEKVLPLVGSLLKWIEQNSSIAILAVIILWIVSMIISIMVSDAFYKKREF